MVWQTDGTATGTQPTDQIATIQSDVLKLGGRLVLPYPDPVFGSEPFVWTAAKVPRPDINRDGVTDDRDLDLLLLASWEDEFRYGWDFNQDLCADRHDVDLLFSEHLT